MKRCLVWDFDGTLAWRPGKWSGALAQAAAEEGYAVDLEFFRPFLQRGFPWHSPDITRPVAATADSWWNSLQLLFETALTAVEGMDKQAAVRASRAVRRIYCDPSNWRLFDDAAPALKELALEGWVHIILSNHVPELSGIVKALDLTSYFEAVISSGITGIEKPHPAAFDLVYDFVGQDAEAVMVGDSWQADICGANSAGMEAILVRNTHPEAGLQCEGLQNINKILNWRTSRRSGKK